MAHLAPNTHFFSAGGRVIFMLRRRRKADFFHPLWCRARRKPLDLSNRRHQVFLRRHGACTLYRIFFMATRIPKTPSTPPAQKPAGDDGDSVVLERRPQKTAPPQMYQVVMLNDDYTP